MVNDPDMIVAVRLADAHGHPVSEHVMATNSWNLFGLRSPFLLRARRCIAPRVVPRDLAMASLHRPPGAAADFRQRRLRESGRSAQGFLTPITGLRMCLSVRPKGDARLARASVNLFGQSLGFFGPVVVGQHSRPLRCTTAIDF